MNGVHQLLHFLEHPTGAGLAVLAGVLIVGWAVAYLGLRVSPTALVCTGLALEIFSGSWNHLHVPFPLDRLGPGEWRCPPRCTVHRGQHQAGRYGTEPS